MAERNKKTRRKGYTDRAELLKRFGYLAHVTVKGFVDKNGLDGETHGAKTYLLTDIFVTDEDDHYLYLEHMWVKGDLFKDDYLGMEVIYQGEIRMYQKGTGKRSFEIVPLEIRDVMEPC